MAAEPSAFGAGDLREPHPYGLTESEKITLQNKEEIADLKANLFGLKSQIQVLSENIEGLRSIIEGLNHRVMELQRSPSQPQEENLSVQALQESLNKNVELQNQNFDQIRAVLKELSSIIDNINANYVTKEELAEALKNLSSSSKPQARLDDTKKNNAGLLKEAVSLFQQKEYDKSKPIFEDLLKKGYKAATSSYYLGEISYYQKEYNTAIDYFKKSATLYDKSDFMPTLLLHTAISFEELKDKENARAFYDSVIDSYPDSKAAKIAKEKRAKL